MPDDLSPKTPKRTTFPTRRTRTATTPRPQASHPTAEPTSPNQDGSPGVQRALYIGKGNPKSAYNHSVSPAGLTAAGTPILNINDWTHNAKGYTFTCPTNVNSGLFCDVLGRNSLYGLRQYNVDAALSKHISITEQFKLTLQAAFFDVDGHVEWGDPVGDVNNPSFGKSTSANGREGQLSARIDF